MLDPFMSPEVEWWLERRREDSQLLWVGTGAKVLGLKGKADPEMVRQVLCDGVGPNGEQLDTPVAATYERADCTTFRQRTTVSYWIQFQPHETVHALLTGPKAREDVLEAHWVAMGEALEALETIARLGLVGVAAMIYDKQTIDDNWHHTRQPWLMTEVVFAASGYHGVEDVSWQWLGTAHGALCKFLRSAWRARETYQRRLGEELAARLGVEVAYEVSWDYGLPVAVVRS